MLQRGMLVGLFSVVASNATSSIARLSEASNVEGLKRC
jgi:hypothetical protein